MAGCAGRLRELYSLAAVFPTLQAEPMSEPELVMSPLCQSMTHDGHTIQVEIYKSTSSRWILEVVDELGNSTVWEDQFASDGEALNELHRTIQEEGIASMVGPVADEAN